MFDYLPVIAEDSFAILDVNGAVEAFDFFLAVIGTGLVVVVVIIGISSRASYTERTGPIFHQTNSHWLMHWTMDLIIEIILPISMNLIAEDLFRQQ